jgi:2-oxoglutarate dehydrogenase E2 component (dihydrolipoamide succinyltransferase)
MTSELKVPTMGESITEVQIGQWHKQPGERAAKNETLVEIESDKATIELPAPADGMVSQVLKRQGDTAKVGEVIGYFEEQAEARPQSTTEKPAASAEAERQPPQSAAEKKESPAAEVAEQPPAEPAEPARVMPAARRALAAQDLRAEEVKPTGPGGRLLKENVLRAATAERAPAIQHPVAAISPRHDARTEKVVPMTMIRRRIAQRLVEAQQSAALLTTFNEIDMSAVIALRRQYRETFEKQHGVKLGFMSFFVRATVEALRAFPAVNAEIRDRDIVYHNYYDIGIAVGGGKGLVVPVLRDADRMTFAQIELAIADFGRRAQENKLELHELEGGTFTISNGGIYGSLLSTPIVNPPQSGILGLHVIEDRPVARDGAVVIRPMMYVALTYDHRIVDGREAVTFLRRIKELIEDPNRLLLEV